MTDSYRRRLWTAAVASVLLGAAVIIWWLLRDPTPYSLRKTPAVTVAVGAATSQYPDARQVAGDVDLLVKVYVQRLQAGDATDLARIGAPWYTGKEQAAQKLIARYGAQAAEPVEAIVEDPVVPSLAKIELCFSDGQRQTVYLSRDHDDVWWLQLGDGDPVAP
ncbi:hypothetical protein ACIRJO_26350 [Streptomyces sp. NPDC102394]|uniref:hypothetical protein n=1 Tax=Streptomyces sp. NPDC102394 TaxID=3366167 RepID=UPI003820D4EF